MPDDRVEALVDLLEAKNLDYIEVIPFDLDDDDEEEDDEDEDQVEEEEAGDD